MSLFFRPSSRQPPSRHSRLDRESSPTTAAQPPQDPGSPKPRTAPPGIPVWLCCCDSRFRDPARSSGVVVENQVLDVNAKRLGEPPEASDRVGLCDPGS